MSGRVLSAWSVACLLACGHADDTTAASTDASNPDTHITSATAPTDANASDTNPETLCAPLCDKLDECGLSDDFPACPCLVGEMELMSCQIAWQRAADCFYTSSCDQLTAEDSQCWADFLRVNELCAPGGDGCKTSLLAEDPDEGTCKIVEDCLDAPNKTLRCVSTGCTCSIENKDIASCEAEDACQDFMNAYFCCNGPI